MKNIAECQEEFFAYFIALETYSVHKRQALLKIAYLLWAFEMSDISDKTNIFFTRGIGNIPKISIETGLLSDFSMKLTDSPESSWDNNHHCVNFWHY